MRASLRRLLPDQEKLRANRWLRWIGPAAHHPRLWRFSRQGVSLGVAIGVFFGLLVPIAQIPLSAAAAVILRAHVPAAVASTLVTNPVTFGPLYLAAYRIGSALVGEDPPHADEVIPEPHGGGLGERLRFWGRKLAALGKPLLVGLATLATAMGLAAYLLITGLWRLSVWWAWRRRQRRTLR